MTETNNANQRFENAAPHLLVVDDAEANRNLIRLYFAQTPCVLDFAENGVEAVKKFCETSYDLVLMDLSMPVMDGLEATRLIREHEEREEAMPTPVLAVTAHTHGPDKENCREAGCSDLLTKPVRKNELLNTVADFLELP